MWHLWKQHHQIECFWKLLKSVFQVRAMYLERVAEFIGCHPVLHFFLLPLYLSSMVTPFRSFLPIP
jgi:hypothetical protein